MQYNPWDIYIWSHYGLLWCDILYINIIHFLHDIQAHTVYPKKYAHSFCFVVVIHWLIFPYPSGLLHWHCGNLTIAPVPAKQPWCIWINTSCEFIMNDCITTTKQSTTKPCAYFLGYTVHYSIYTSWLLPWHLDDHTIGPLQIKQPWRKWVK